MCYLFISKCADSHCWSTWKSQPGMDPNAVKSTQIVRVTLCPRGFALWFSRDMTAGGMGKWHWKNHQQVNILKMEAGLNFTMEFCRAVLKTLSYFWASYLSLMAISICWQLCPIINRERYCPSHHLSFCETGLKLCK